MKNSGSTNPASSERIARSKEKDYHSSDLLIITLSYITLAWQSNIEHLHFNIKLLVITDYFSSVD